MIDYFNKHSVMQAIAINPMLLKDPHFPEKFKSDKEIITLAVKNNAMSLEHVPDNFKRDPSIAAIAVNQKCLSLKFLDEKIIRERQDLVRRAVKNNPKNIQFIPEELNDYKEIVGIAIENDRNILDSEYISNAFKEENEEFISNILQRTPSAPRLTCTDPEGVPGMNFLSI